MRLFLFSFLYCFASCSSPKEDKKKFLIPAMGLSYMNQSCAAVESNYTLTSTSAAKNGTYSCSYADNVFTCLDGSGKTVRQYSYNSLQEFVLERKTLGLIKAFKSSEGELSQKNSFDSLGRILSSEISGNSDPRISQEKREFSSYDSKGRPLDSKYSYVQQASMGSPGGVFQFSEKMSYDDNEKKLSFDLYNAASRFVLNREFTEENILSTESVRYTGGSASLDSYKLNATVRVCY